MSGKGFILEACVETLDEAVKAERNGANRLELCSSLHLDGLTPDTQLTEKVLASVTIPVKVMIRSRPGDFEYSHEELLIMKEEVRELAQLGASGFVFGAIFNDQLDLDAIAEIAEVAGTIPVTVHKAIDSTVNPVESALRLLNIDNIKSILTSGGRATAIEGQAVINAMHEAVDGNLAVIAAGKITAYGGTGTPATLSAVGPKSTKLTTRSDTVPGAEGARWRYFGGK